MKKRYLKESATPHFRINYIGYIIAFYLIFMGFTSLLALHLESTTSIARSSLQTNGLRIGGTAKAAADHVRLLRDAAQLSLSQMSAQRSSLLFLSLREDPAKDRYELPIQPTSNTKDISSFITGGGKIPTPGTDRAQELEAIIRLNPILADTKHNVPQSTWVYYYSENRFINLYPFEGQMDHIRWTDAYLDSQLFHSALPHENPLREVRWLPPYIDEGGKGLVTSIVAPVYDQKNRFRGMVGMDFTLATMKSFLNGMGLDKGISMLVDKRGQVFAHPEAAFSQNKTLPFLADVLPKELKSMSAQLLNMKTGEYDTIPGWKIHILDIPEAPWRLIFLIDKHQLIWNTLREMGAEIAGLVLMILMLFFVYQRQRMARSLRMYKAAVDSSLAAIVISDRQGVIQYVNQSFVDITGYSEAEALGHKTNLLKSGVTSSEVYKELWDTLLSNKNWTGQLLNKKKDGTLFWEHIRISQVTGNKDDGHYVAVMEDVTELRNLMEALNHLATTDPLTAVANRRFFMDEANKELQRATRYQKNMALLAIDIDHFKQINDHYGHGAGDLVLKQFASQCAAQIRQQDILGRIGGEEFSVLLPEVDLAGAMIVAQRIIQAISTLEIPLSDTETVKITCSIGVATRHETDDQLELIISRADVALYQAKNAGRNCVIPEVID